MVVVTLCPTYLGVGACQAVLHDLGPLPRSRLPLTGVNVGKQGCAAEDVGCCMRYSMETIQIGTEHANQYCQLAS